jgi:hypothetical protein
MATNEDLPPALPRLPQCQGSARTTPSGNSTPLGMSPILEDLPSLDLPSILSPAAVSRQTFSSCPARLLKLTVSTKHERELPIFSQSSMSAVDDPSSPSAVSVVFPACGTAAAATTGRSAVAVERQDRDRSVSLCTQESKYDRDRADSGEERPALVRSVSMNLGSRRVHSSVASRQFAAAAEQADLPVEGVAQNYFFRKILATDRSNRGSPMSPDQLLQKVCRVSESPLIDQVGILSIGQLARERQGDSFLPSQSAKRLSRTRETMARLRPPAPGNI